MEWIKDYWYVALFGLVAAMYFFGHRSKNEHPETRSVHHEEETGEKEKKSSHSCCH